MDDAQKKATNIDACPSVNDNSVAQDPLQLKRTTMQPFNDEPAVNHMIHNGAVHPAKVPALGDMNRNIQMDSTVTTFTTGTRVSEIVKEKSREENSGIMQQGPVNASQLLAAAATQARNSLKPTGGPYPPHMSEGGTHPIVTSTLVTTISGKTACGNKSTTVAFASKTVMSTLSPSITAPVQSGAPIRSDAAKDTTSTSQITPPSSTMPPPKVCESVVGENLQGWDTAGPSVATPYLWKRVLEEMKVVYYSPTNDRLTSLEEVKEHLLTEGTCKCGLPCPFRIEEVFQFDAAIQSREWSPHDLGVVDIKSKQKCCQIKHMKSHAASTVCIQYSPSPVKKPASKRKASRSKSTSADKSPSIPLSPVHEYKGKLVSEMIAQRAAGSTAPSSTGLSVDTNSRVPPLHAVTPPMPMLSPYGPVISPTMPSSGAHMVRQPRHQPMISPNQIPYQHQHPGHQHGQHGEPYVPFGVPVYSARPYYPPPAHHIVHGPHPPGHMMYHRYPMPPGQYQPAPMWQQRPTESTKKKISRSSSVSSAEGNSDTGYQSELSSPVGLSPSHSKAKAKEERSTEEQKPPAYSAKDSGAKHRESNAVKESSMNSPTTHSEKPINKGKMAKKKETFSVSHSPEGNHQPEDLSPSAQSSMHPPSHHNMQPRGLPPIMRPIQHMARPPPGSPGYFQGPPPGHLLRGPAVPHGPPHGPPGPGYYQYVGPYPPPQYPPHYMVQPSPEHEHPRSVIPGVHSPTHKSTKKGGSPEAKSKTPKLEEANGAQSSPPESNPEVDNMEEKGRIPSAPGSVPVRPPSHPGNSMIAALPPGHPQMMYRMRGQAHPGLPSYGPPPYGPPLHGPPPQGHMYYRPYHPGMVPHHPQSNMYHGHAQRMAAPPGYPPGYFPGFPPHTSPPNSPPAKKKRKRAKPKSDESLSAHLHQVTMATSTKSLAPGQINGTAGEKTVKLAAIDTILSKPEAPTQQDKVETKSPPQEETDR